MKPSRSYHALSAEHREPGGLRRLDYVVERIAAWQKDRLPSLLRVLIVSKGDGAFALPVASLGYVVTVCEEDARVREYLIESAKDVGVALRAVENLEAVQKEHFDVVVAGDALAFAANTEEFFQRIASFCGDHSLFFIALRSHPRRMSWKRFEAMLRKGGYTIREALPLSVFFRRVASFFFLLGMKRGGGAFHFFDGMDNWLAAHVSPLFADGWLAEICPFDVSRPLVMHVVPTFSAGGAERLVSELVQRLPSRGYAAEAVAIMGGGPLTSVFEAAALPHQIFERRGPFGIGSLFQLRRLLQRKRPAIVHTHLFGADLWGRVMARTVGIRCLVTTEHNVHPEHGAVKRWINRTLARITSVCVAVSGSVKTYMEVVEKIPSERIRVVRNGIDLTSVVARPSHPFHDVPRLIIVGRLVPQKGHATLLKALALVKQPWALQIVGTGPLEKDLRALVDRLSIAPRVHWLGYRADVPTLLAEADLFCFPSLWEGLGLAFVEAAAAGIPIVATDLPVLHDVLGASSCAYVPSGDVPRFARAIEDILRDPVSAIASAQRAIPRVQAAFSIDQMVDGYARLYDELLRDTAYADSSRQ